jgi:dienelactone hydrolase
MTEKLHPCCDPTFPTPIWEEGSSTGKIITIDDIETYIAHPRKSGNRASSSDQQHGKRVILHLTEGHIIYFLNAQLLADSFATHLNCDVIMPDQFRGKRRVPAAQLPFFPEGKAEVPPPVEGSDRIPPPYHKAQTHEGFEIWKQTHLPPVIDPVLERVVQYIRKTYGEDVKIGGVGYCFGGRFIMRLMGPGVIDVGVVNHPSFYTLDEVAKLGSNKRLAIHAAETDDIHTPEIRRATEDTLTNAGAIWMSTVFSATHHGFSVRGDLSIKMVRLAKERASEALLSGLMTGCK